MVLLLLGWAWLSAGARASVSPVNYQLGFGACRSDMPASWVLISPTLLSVGQFFEADVLVAQVTFNNPVRYAKAKELFIAPEGLYTGQVRLQLVHLLPCTPFRFTSWQSCHELQSCLRKLIMNSVLFVCFWCSSSMLARRLP